MSVRRIARAIMNIENVYISSWASAVGKMEGDGPLGGRFDRVFEDNTLGEDSWEKAESRLLLEAVTACCEKSGTQPDGVDLLYSGDLLNQCIASTFGLSGLRIPHVGMYGACSTMASTLLSASIAVASGAADTAVAATGSHFSSSERQFRTPLQYGGQRPPTAQRTVTGAGAMLLTGGSSDRSASDRACVRITACAAGIIEDLGITDPNNMGAAMAPAAASTVKRFLEGAKCVPGDFDLILTGDLGAVGSELLCELLGKDGIDISRVHNDGGLMMFDRDRQDVHAGGSGCGCSACVLAASVLPELAAGRLGRVLFVGTGALMSTTSSYQGQSIPGIAHAVELRAM